MTATRYGERMAERPDARARLWNVVAVVVAAVTAVAVTVLPTGSSTSTDSSGVVTSSRTSLLGTEGDGILVVVAVPVLCVAVPLMLRNGRHARIARQVAVSLLVVMVVLGALSIGVFFVPTLVAMIVSVVTSPRTAS